MNLVKIISIAFAFAAIVVFSGVAGPSIKNTAQKKAVMVPDKELLFFMNPNGHPCRIQDEILGDIKDSLATLATVKYIKTTDEAAREAFEKYGIRGLPTLIIADTKGNELSRFTPGVQDKSTILRTLHSLQPKQVFPDFQRRNPHG